VTLTATVTDNDGDKALASVDVGSHATFHDDGPSVTAVASTAALSLDEGNTNAGSPPTSTAATINTGAIVKGDDPDVTGTGYISHATSTTLVTPTIVFGADGPFGGSPATGTNYALTIGNVSSGLKVTDGSAINLVDVNGDGSVIVGVVQAGAFAGQAAFAISINAATGAMTVEQYLSLQHPAQATAANGFVSYDETVSLAAGSLDVVVTVKDGDSDQAVSNAVDISSKISFHDDGPLLGSFVSGTIPNEVGTVNGTFAFNPGADGFQSFSITGPVITGLTYTETHTATGDLLTASSGATTVFTLQVNSDGTYAFNLVSPQVATTEVVDLTALAAGNSPNFAETTDGRVEFSSPGSVNSSTQGFGIGNQFISSTEQFTMEFHKNGNPGVDDPANSDVEFASAVSLVINNINGAGAHTYTWTATDTVHNLTESGTFTVNGSDATPETILIDPLLLSEFNQLTIAGLSGGGLGIRLETANIITTLLPQDEQLAFSITATDGDGDTTAASSLNVHVVADTAGNYTLTGGAGNDVIATSSAIDTVNGGTGFNIVDYRDDTAGVTVNLATGSGSGGTAAGDTYTFIDGALGGTGNDTLIGNGNANLLDGGAGNNTLTGAGGNDTFVLHAGQNDIIDFNASGADQIFLDVADQSGTFGTATTITAAQLDVGTDHNVDAQWGSHAADSFFVQNSGGVTTLWFSATGHAAQAVQLATISTGINPANTDIHTF
jgi:hypothetical protein